MNIKKDHYGNLQDGTQVQLFTLTNSNSMTVKIMNYGGTIVSIEVPDRDGKLDDITLGYDSLEEYCSGTYFFGALIGRHANRIENSEFNLNGITYHLAKYDCNIHLQGVNRLFDNVVWEAIILEDTK